MLVLKIQHRAPSTPFDVTQDKLAGTKLTYFPARFAIQKSK